MTRVKFPMEFALGYNSLYSISLNLTTFVFEISAFGSAGQPAGRVSLRSRRGQPSGKALSGTAAAFGALRRGALSDSSVREFPPDNREGSDYPR